MDILGIPCETITGTAGGIGHAWNAVMLDDEWYMVDVTWDDPVPDTPGQVLYGYFNITDEKMKQDHKMCIRDSGTAIILDNMRWIWKNMHTLKF